MDIAALQRDIAKLNPEQREAVATVYGPLLVLAGAGTGKTKVITTRIAHMISKGIAPASIVAVSFTNKAAREMRERVALLVGEKTAKTLELSTFHSFALRLLRKYSKKAGLRANFTISDERESLELLKESLKEQNLSEMLPLALAVEKMAWIKDQVMTADDLDHKANIFDKVILKSVFDSYNRRLRLYNLVDFDDIIYLLVLMLRSHPDVLEEIQNAHPFLLIDEYQDTSRSQFELIRLIGQKSQNVCVVGDDDQSIYSWRGANPESIIHFLNAFQNTKRVTLEQNYRCSPNILKAANAVISENTGRLGKTLWSQQPNLHSLQIHAAENERDEALFVVDTIAGMRHEPGFDESHVTILIRASAQSLAFEQVFQERNIPYHVHGGSRFFDRTEIRDLISYLKLAHNPNDLNSLFRIINTPARGIGIATLEKIKSSMNAGGAELSSTLNELAKTHKGIHDFATRWNQSRVKFEESQNLADVVNALTWSFENVGLKDEIMQSSKSMQAANFRLELVEKFFTMASGLELKNDSLAGVIDTLHLDTPQFERTRKHEKGVQIMTIHASKGLEFPTVFIVGTEENIIPHERSIDSPGGVEEERRLFYVALTRAKQRLYISHCGFRKKSNSGRQKEPSPSRFLQNIPEEQLNRTTTDPETEEARRQSAAKRLFELFR